jgi:signal transduction histidine kinase
MPIRVRIGLYAAGVVAITLFIFSVFIYGASKRNLRDQQDRLLLRRAQEAVEVVLKAPPNDLSPRPPLAPVDLAFGTDSFIEILDSGGTVISTTATLDGAPPPVPSDALARAAGSGVARADATVGKRPPLRLAVVPWSRDDAGRSGYVVAGQTVATNENALRGLRVLLALTALLSLAGASAAMWLVLGRALRPLGVMARTADEIGYTRDLNRRLPAGDRHDEVGMLAASFNGMLARLQEAHRALAWALASQKRFVADASHELRTPLTSIRNNAAFLLRHDQVDESDRTAALHDIADESERMARLVQDLLTLARADAGQRLDKHPLDLTNLVRAVCRRAGAAHPTRTVEARGDGPVMVEADADALTQLLWIMLDNAAKHTRDGGHVTVHTAARSGRAFLSVADDGEGIPEGETERIFDRFYQADASRGSGGAGLGLAIARWIVSEHGGSISAHTNPSGGATFRVDLPLCAEDAAQPLPELSSTS